jgi:hypothetical protein
VVAFPDTWFEYWLGRVPELRMDHRRPLIGDPTVWLDPCLDGGEMCIAEKINHCATDSARATAALIRGVQRHAPSQAICDAFSWPFFVTAGRSTTTAFHMHDCIATAYSAVPDARGWTEPGTRLFQFRQADAPDVAAGALDAVVRDPQSVRLSPGPAVSPEDLELFRDALAYSRPVGTMRNSAARRAAMRALAEEFAAMISVPRSAPSEHTNFYVTMELHEYVQHHPVTKVQRAKMLEDAAKTIARSAADAGISVVSVDGSIGKVLTITFAVPAR